MTVVLGIDAAWTNSNPSGLAIARKTSGRWALHSVWASYEDFLDAEMADAGQLPSRIYEMLGETPDLIAIDMPLCELPIAGRRAADQMVSQIYGARGASTHSPSAERPGSLSDKIRRDLALKEYHLRHAGRPDGKLAEVYPHPALIEFMRAPRRLPYKIQRSRKYWPGIPPELRRNNLISEWARILDALALRLPGTKTALPLPTANASVKKLKSFEDQLDAIICAAIAIEILEGRATSYGDTNSAIWIPTPATSLY